MFMALRTFALARTGNWRMDFPYAVIFNSLVTSLSSLDGGRKDSKVDCQALLESHVIEGVDNAVIVEIKSLVIDSQGLLEPEVVSGIDDFVAVDVAE
jgi:hypothetical protein